MALKVSRSDLFPVGQSVGAYAGIANRHHGGKPSGAAAETATVAADGTLTFAGLAEGVYWLYASVAGATVNLQAGSQGFTAPGNLRARLLAARTAVGAPALA